MNSLVNRLIQRGFLKSDSVIEAFSEISRFEFVPKNLEAESNADVPLPIGYGQTISQPATVAAMLEMLNIKSGQNVLDVGSGSGWLTALICHIVGKQGKVTALERIGGLIEFGKSNVEKFGYLNDGGSGIAEFYEADGKNGFKKNAPYDRILVSAAAKDLIPEALKEQLKIGGKMVIPVKNNLVYLEKKSENDFYKEEYAGFSFVPLI